jgi:hypothetical protein
LIRFQSPIVTGITGWMLRTFATSSSGPTPNRVLFWNGRLIIAATGFCAALARSAWSCANAGELYGIRAAANSKSRLVIGQVHRLGRLGARARAPATLVA